MTVTIPHPDTKSRGRAGQKGPEGNWAITPGHGRGSRPQHIWNTNCKYYRGPNDETPPADLLMDKGSKTDICANTLFCGGRGTEPGRRGFCEVAHDKMAVKYTNTNTAKRDDNLPDQPDPNAKIEPSQVCQKKPATIPKEILPNTTRG